MLNHAEVMVQAPKHKRIQEERCGTQEVNSQCLKISDGMWRHQLVN